MKHLDIFTDGACSGNPGPGGWAAVLRYEAKERELSGAEPDTTNNRMELRAAIEALKVLKEPCEITLTTDSQYLRQGITSWMTNWKRRGWQTASKQPVKNKDLWVELDALAQRHKITWEWVKGHAAHPETERCDELAVAAIAKLRGRRSPRGAARR